jgi:uncharacterized protein YndB with AHSA1/START domain
MERTTSEAGATPLVKTVTVGADRSRAFELFTEHLARWWPLGTHSVGRDEAVSVTMATAVGGEIVETTRAGDRHVWGTVTTWGPPDLVGFTWHPGQDPAQGTHVTVRFHDVAGGTEVELTHEGWGLRPDGPRARTSYDAGWELVLGRLAACAG